MVPGHPPCALCSLISRRSDPETNRFGKISFTLKLVFPESFLSLCSCQGALLKAWRALKTIQSFARLRILAIILFERSLTFRFASLKLF